MTFNKDWWSSGSLNRDQWRKYLPPLSVASTSPMCSVPWIGGARPLRAAFARAVSCERAGPIAAKQWAMPFLSNAIQFRGTNGELKAAVPLLRLRHPTKADLVGITYHIFIFH